MKPTVAIYGNCQTEALRLLLREHAPFVDRFEIVVLKPVHQMTMDERNALLESAPRYDFLITQQIGETYAPATSAAVIAAMRPGAQAIVIPGAWFNGYFPDAIYPREVNGAPVIGGPCDFHSSVVLRAYVEGASASAAVARLAEEVDPDTVAANIDTNFKEMRLRESDLEITISDFIEARFRHEKLFHVINHPAAPVMFHITDQVLRVFGLPPTTNEAKIRRANLLDLIKWKINPSLAAELGLSFPLPEEYRFIKTYHTTEDMVDRFYEYYDRRPDLISRYREKFAAMDARNKNIVSAVS